MILIVYRFVIKTFERYCTCVSSVTLFSTPVLTLLSLRKLWETQQELSQNLAI